MGELDKCELCVYYAIIDFETGRDVQIRRFISIICRTFAIWSDSNKNFELNMRKTI
jgi:hypothetical protein